MRILWLSNSPLVQSGYGEQTKMFTPRIRDLGHEVAIAANFGIQATTTVWDGMPVYPAQAHNATVSTFARVHQADWVITLYDTWVFKPKDWDDDLEHVAMWAPVDEWPPPVPVMEVLRHPKVRPIAMSRFGEHWLRKAGLDPLYVPHGVDTAVFRPLEDGRQVARQILEMPDDAFVVGMVAANRGWSLHACRKAFPQAFDAFGQFARRHDDAYMYCHTQATPAPPGMDLVMCARAMGIPEDRIAFPPDVAWHLHVMDNQFVAGVMNGFDVLLNPSMSEGFGIPIIEAQACGVPVIASDHSSMPELTQSGWLVSGDRWWDGSQLSFGIMPSVDSILERLEEAYENRGNQALRDDAFEFAQTYDVDRVTETYWRPTLEALEGPREVGPIASNGLNRQQRRALAKTR
jgi:glycosyltransferase involved in cell wall biosynthesis